MDRRSFILLILFTTSIFFIHRYFDQDTQVKKPSEQISQATSPTEQIPTATKAVLEEEKFYVIENDYQQIVFSNIGGAIAEINLPFKTPTNQNSIVLPIEIDTILQNKYSTNASFPLHPYFTAGSPSPKQPITGGYSPLLRRSILSPQGKTTFQLPPKYYGLNILSDAEEELDNALYRVKRLEKNKIVFELTQNHRKITKTYRFAEEASQAVPYALVLDIQIEGDARGLMLTSGIPEVEMISGSPAPDIKYYYERNQKKFVDKLKLPKTTSSIKGSHIEWVDNSNGFFGVIINAITDKLPSFEVTSIPGVKDPTRLSVIDSQHNLYPASKYPGYLISIPLKPTSKTMSFRVFAGPFDHGILAKVDQAFQDAQMNDNPNFLGAQSFHGWFAFISEPFAKFLFTIMKFFYSFTHSWGFCIILLTIVLKIILYPLTNWSMRSMTRMQIIAPEAAALKTRFSKDPKRYNIELMQLYKDRGVSPFSSFLPMIIQMPFLLGMFDLLKSTFPLRGSCFIPGWIDNLTAPDVLFSWSYPIVFIGTQFHLLPFILGGLTFLQQKYMAQKNKTAEVDAGPGKNMGNIMTIIFILFFYNCPSGLNIYWISSTGLGILQQWLITSRLKLSPVKNLKKS
ncbi:MAG: membrane protein insertase YidC [Chlamydiota bacterium]